MAAMAEFGGKENYLYSVRLTVNVQKTASVYFLLEVYR